MATRVQVIHEALRQHPGQWGLAFQWCQYIYEDGTSEHGYRFIWRRPDGTLQPARGQARLPSLKVIETFLQQAKDKGWGELNGDQQEVAMGLPSGDE